MKYIPLDRNYLPDSNLELQFADLWLVSGSQNQLYCQYPVKPKGNRRPYLLDFAHPGTKVAVEIQGGTWMQQSGHKSGRGLNRDYTKLNRLQIEGWVVIQLSVDMITLEWVEKIDQLINRKTNG